MSIINLLCSGHTASAASKREWILIFSLDKSAKRLLVLDALRKKVPWYSNKDFCALNSSDLAGASETVRMYLDLQSEEDSAVLDAYCDSYYT